MSWLWVVAIVITIVIIVIILKGVLEVLSTFLGR